MGKIRPFQEADIPQTANLHQSVFGVPTAPDIDQRYRQYFLTTFLSAQSPAAQPLVHEEDDGRISGFLGVAGRRFTVAGRRISAAVSSQLVVDPEARKRLAGVMLLRHFLMGPRDLSFADEANESSRRVWETLGGKTASSYSMHWIAPLKPAKYLMTQARNRWTLLAKAVSPLAGIADAAFAPTRRRLLKDDRPALKSEDFPLEAVPELVSQRVDYAMKPAYAAGELWSWAGDTIHRTLLRRPSADIAGWYVYHLPADGIGEVLQVGCNYESASEVMSCLFTDAVNRGAIALCGRLEPHVAHALPHRFPILYRHHNLMLVHSRDSRILDAIRSGNALLSRIDGEWPIRFR